MAVPQRTKLSRPLPLPLPLSAAPTYSRHTHTHTYTATVYIVVVAIAELLLLFFAHSVCSLFSLAFCVSHLVCAFAVFALLLPLPHCFSISRHRCAPTTKATTTATIAAVVVVAVVAVAVAGVVVAPTSSSFSLFSSIALPFHFQFAYFANSTFSYSPIIDVKGRSCAPRPLLSPPPPTPTPPPPPPPPSPLSPFLLYNHILSSCQRRIRS